MASIAVLPRSLSVWVEQLRIKGHPNLYLAECDLTDMGSSMCLLKRAKAMEVRNLIVQSFAAVSCEYPITTAMITGLWPVLLLEAIRFVNPRIRFYAEIYPLSFGENLSN